MSRRMRTDGTQADAEEGVAASATRFKAQREALGGSAYDQIRDAIASGNLKPGQRITEAGLAKWLSMSRTPVREAILKLESEGLLAHLPRQGLSVRKLTYQEVIELYAMREVLEGTAARFAAVHASDAEVEMLRDIVHSERASEVPDATEAARLNKRFHRVIYRAGHNRYLLESLRALADTMILLGNTTLALPGRHAEALHEHDAILSAIEAKDPDAAESAARAHIQAAKRNRIKLLLGDDA